MELTERQRNELEYHREHARENADILEKPFSWDVLDRPARRWWNAYWHLYTHITDFDLRDKRVLVVGCGFGDDALRIAKLGAKVFAFDLSPESLSIARSLAEREGLDIEFTEMPAESLLYEDDFFDYVIVRDILHHVDIPRAMSEIRRVSKPGALFLMSEIYSHSMTDRIRNSHLVENVIYPKMQRYIYGKSNPYITEDERKLTEQDVREILKYVKDLNFTTYFDFLVTRIIPQRFTLFAKLDRLVLKVLRPIGHWVAGRIMFSGHIAK
ncbi:MAG: class I SAM-dependent methyltransferase [Gammaproteobacteria bacterium]|nr:class I SAM-dependent methyltransferase [Gammaproteobacteria bacterium]